MFISKSYYPLHNLYFEVLVKIINEVKLHTLEIFKDNEIEIEKNEDLSIFDSDCQIGILNNKVKSDIDRLVSRVFMPQFESNTIEFDFFNKIFEYKVPDLLNLSYLDASYCCYQVFKDMSFENFLFIFLKIFEEKSLVFVSENMNKISTSM